MILIVQSGLRATGRQALHRTLSDLTLAGSQMSALGWCTEAELCSLISFLNDNIYSESKAAYSVSERQCFSSFSMSTKISKKSR